MPDFLSMGRTGFDLLLVVLGFGLIIFVHELGHFAAAKWARIRVLAFAMGIGPAIVSYRKGFGLRRGSSEPAYLQLVKAEKEGINRVSPHGVSPTEYRLNWLPIGGYVKMLGQDDLDPGAVSEEKDSYQNTPVWKRMIVISAGVVMNVLMAAVLFIVVFMHGLETEPAVIGGVGPGLPAATAVATNAEAAGVKSPGLKPGDLVLEVNGRPVREFTDLVMASAMSSRGEAVSLLVKRPDVAELLRFEVTPRYAEGSKLLEMGVEPARSSKLMSVKTDEERSLFAKAAEKAGVPGLEPGMRLVRAGDNAKILSGGDLTEAVRRSDGKPVEVEFAADGESGKRVAGVITPRAEPQVGYVPMPGGASMPVSHLLGLVPVMMVAPMSDGSEEHQGLRDGDIFARIGAVEFPSRAQGIAEVRRHKGGTVPVTVLRRVDGVLTYVDLPPPTVHNRNGGQIGFSAGDCFDTDTLVALPAPLATMSGGEVKPRVAASLITRPGTRIVAVEGTRVSNFTELREALRRATAAAFRAGDGEAQVPMDLELPVDSPGSPRRTERVTWTLGAADVRSLHELGWSVPGELPDFEPESIEVKAKDPIDAIGMGIRRTQRVMVMTYLTFARLVEGTVKVEHLKGPVGIAHMGTRIAERGLVWLLFFMAMISVNLAVINFLPLPIVDGGQFIFLVLEQIRGKPVSIEVQNVATVVGLVLIGAVFIVVTFHDIAGLFG